MYRRILVPLENSTTDVHIVRHVQDLARHCGASLVFIHVADGWAARNLSHLKLRESEEIKRDRDYIEQIAREAGEAGLTAEAVLASGDPAREICEAAHREGCDLIAMATHGHRLIGDVIHGSVANDVRHATAIPVLLVRAPGTGRSA